MKKIMGHLTGKLSLSILSVIVLLVGVLAGNRITSIKASGKNPAVASRSSNGLASVSESLPAAKHGTPARTLAAAHSRSTSRMGVDDMKTAVTKLPLTFEPNVGQSESRVKYIARTAGYGVFLTGSSSATFVFPRDGKLDRLSMNLVGADASASGQAEDPTGGVTNYYIGNDRSKWHRDVPNYAKVRYRNVYPGVDVIYQGDNNHLRYDFLVKAGADPKAIEFAYNNAGKLAVDEHGTLLIDTQGGGRFAGTKPVVFQEYGGQKHMVDGSYVVTADNQAKFQIGSYDRSHDLVIDPDLVTYGIYIGGASTTAGAVTSVTGAAQLTDGSGTAYFSGWTIDLATVGGPGLTDAMLVKVTQAPTGLTVASNTIFGGTGDDVAMAVAVGSDKNPVVVGWTQSGAGFATTNPLEQITQATSPIAEHAFVAEFSGGTSLSFGTLLVGNGLEAGVGVAVDSALHIHVAGSTTSTNFLSNLPAVQAGGSLPYQSVLNSTGASSGGPNASSNAFYVELAAGGAGVIYDTYLGGWGTDVVGSVLPGPAQLLPPASSSALTYAGTGTGNPIAVDSAGMAYITGTSNSFGAGEIVGITAGTGGSGCTANLSVSFVPPPIQANGSAGTTATGNPIIIGGVVTGVVITNPGAGYLPGSAPAIQFGDTAGFCGGGSPSGWSGITMASALSGGSVNNFPRTTGANFLINPTGTVAPHQHAYVAKFNPAAANPTTAGAATNPASLVYSVYLGGVGGTVNTNNTGLTGPTFDQSDFATSIAVDGFGNAYVTGMTNGTLMALTSMGVVNTTGTTTTFGATQNVVFQAPVGPAGTTGSDANGSGVVAGLTITLAGVGYTPGATGAVTVGGSKCQVNPAATATISPTGELATVTLTNQGFGCASAPSFSLSSGTFGTPSTAAAITPIMGSLVIGLPTANSGITQAQDGFAVEITASTSNSTACSATSLGSNCPTTQDGIQLGTAPPKFPLSATFPSLVYATLVNGDEINGDGANGTNTTSVPAASIVVLSGVAVDPLGQAYITGGANDSTLADEILIHRRITARGFTVPGNAGVGTGGENCTLTFPAAEPQCSPFVIETGYPTQGGAVNANTGDIILAGTAAYPPLTGSGQGIAYDFSTGLSCFGGYIGIPGLPPGTLPPATAATTSSAGFAACTPFINDAEAVTPTGTPNAATATIPAGTTPVLPSGAPNVAPAGNFPANLTLQVEIPSNPGISTTPNISAVTYSPGTSGGADGPVSGSSGSPLPWLVAPVAVGNTVTLNFTGVGDPAVPCTLPLTTACVPNISKLDPGIYTATFTVTPAVGDNSGIPQVVTVTLDVTGVLQVNTTTGGGVLPAGSSASGATITATLTPGTGWTSGGIIDPSNGNLVINIPVISSVPLNSPSNANITFLLNEGTPNSPSPVDSPTIFPVLNNGPMDTVTSGAGAIFLAPASGPESSFLPASPANTLACGSAHLSGSEADGNFVGGTQGSGTVGTAGSTLRGTKSAADDNVCYIQVVLPPTILAGATPGTYTGTFQLQIAPQSTGSGYSGDFTTSPLTGTPSGATLNSSVVSITNAKIAIQVTLGGAGLQITSPWISNGAPSTCGLDPEGPIEYFGPNGAPIIPLAPFAVNTGYSGTLTSNLTAGVTTFGCGNTPPPQVNNITLNTAGLGSSSPVAYTASATGGLGGGLTNPMVSGTTLQNDFTINMAASLGLGSSAPPVPTCTTTSPAIPAGILQFNTSGTLPASNSSTGTTSTFTISIVNPSSLTNGFYASIITVQPTGFPATAAAQIPVCLEVGNNVEPQFEVIPAPVPISAAGPQPPFADGSVVNSLFQQSGTTENIQGIFPVLGPTQNTLFTAIPGGPTFAPPAFIITPLAVTAASTNSTFVTPFFGNIGNEFSAPGTPTPFTPPGIGQQTIIDNSSCFNTKGTGAVNGDSTATGANAATATSGATVSGAPFVPPSCLSIAYEDLVSAPPSGTLSGSFNVGFTVTSTSTNPLLAATGPNGAASFTASLNAATNSGGPALMYTPTPSTTNNLVVAVTSNACGLIAPCTDDTGSGYTSAPTVTFSGGCTVEPTATAILDPGNPGEVLLPLTLNSPGSGCTSPPVVAFSAPQQPGGTLATATAFLSVGTITESFSQMAGGTFINTNVANITVVPSTTGIRVHEGSVYFFGSPTASAWLDVTDNGECNPVTFNPTITFPSNECTIIVATNPIASVLPPGTYYAWIALFTSGTTPVAQPDPVAVLVTLTVGTSPAITSSVSTTAGASFTAFANGTSTSPTSVTTNLGLSAAPASGGASCATTPNAPACTVPFTATVSQSNGPAGWLLINGATTPVTGNLAAPPGTAFPLSISINTATLAGLTNLPLTWNGTITITTPGSDTSNSPIQIPVSITIQAPTGLQFTSPSSFTTAFTIGQAAPATSVFNTTLQQFGTSGTVNFTSSCGTPAVSPCPWITLSPTTTTLGLQPLTITIVPASLPTTPGAALATITATGSASPSSTASASVTVTVAAPPVINLTTLTCTPNPATAGAANSVCTSSAALSVAPANPTSLPATVTATVTGSNCAVTPASSTITLSTTATPLSFTVAPATGTGLSSNCALSVSVATTSGITPAITASTSATITVNQASLTATPTSQVINLPTGAAPAMFTETIQANSTAGPVSVPFTCTPSVSVPAGGSWLTCTSGTTTATGPSATSTGTVTASTLGAGIYGGSLAYSSTQSGVTVPPINVPVTLNIGALTVGPTAVSFAHQLGVTVPVTQNLSISSGMASINWTATVAPNAGTTSCNWLVPGPLSGTTTANSNSSLTVGYNPSGLTPGTYACTIAYSPAASYGAPAADTVPVVVTLTVSSNPVFVLAPPTPQTVTLLYPAPSTTSTFNVSVSSILAPATSISATVTPFPNNPLNGAASPSPLFTVTSPITVTTTPSPLVVNINPAGLPVGTYQGSFTIASTATPNTAVITVNLVISQSCTFTVAPTSTVSLTNAVPVSGTPVSVPGSFSVTPSGGCTAANTWTASSNASWLIITGGSSGNGGGVGTGTYNALSNPTTNVRTATITITPSGASASVITFTQSASSASTVDRQVTALYQTILGRDPDAGGYAFWIGGGTAGLGIMADDFTTSPEAYNTDFAVIAAYQAATGAPPTYAEFTSAVLSLRQGAQTLAGLFTSLSAGTSGYSATNLYMNLLSRAPGAGDGSCATATGAALEACFQTIIGYQATITPVGTSSNSEFWSTGMFANHTASCTTGTCTVPGDHTNALYIRMLYFTILGRDPDSGGLQFWFGVANGGGAGILFQGGSEQSVRIQILGPGTPGQGFIGSPEFQADYQ